MVSQHLSTLYCGWQKWTFMILSCRCLQKASSYKTMTDGVCYTGSLSFSVTSWWSIIKTTRFHLCGINGAILPRKLNLSLKCLSVQKFMYRHAAVRVGNPEFIKLLLTARPPLKVTRKNHAGEDPYSLAKKLGKKKIISLMERFMSEELEVESNRRNVQPPPFVPIGECCR